MGEDLRKKLMGEVLTVEWEVLRVHAERDRLFFVSTVLDLVEVGCAFDERSGADRQVGRRGAASPAHGG